MQQLKGYLKKSDPQLLVSQLQAEEIPQIVYALFSEKDTTIASLQGQYTKQKTEISKLNKMVQSLQDKINQLSPNANNSGSDFMMASEFKDKFDEFMKNTLPIALSPLLQYPQAYQQYTQQFFTSFYGNMNRIIQKKVMKVCTQILQIDPLIDNNLQKMKGCLLRSLQDNWEQIFADIQPLQLNFQNQETKEIEGSEEFIQMQAELKRLCAYMILQEKPWKFYKRSSDNGGNDRHLFSKKEFVCIDGWIKEGQEAVMILQGMFRDSDNHEGQIKHPNLKNYVIPFQQNSPNQYKLIKSNEQTNILSNQLSSGVSSMVERGCQYENILILHTDQTSNINQQLTSSPQIHVDTQYDSITELNKQKSLITINPNPEPIKQPSQVNSPMIPLQPIYLNNSIVGMSHNSKSKKDKKTDKSSRQNKNTNKSKHCLISDPSFEDIITIPKNRTNNPKANRKLIDQLPLKRDTSKIKKTNSRKGSVGKIVGQNVNENYRQQKENRNSNMSKQVLYKDIIKQKLCENLSHKTQRSTKQQKQPRIREEDRPLRVMHMKKIRDKYLNL